MLMKMYICPELYAAYQAKSSLATSRSVQFKLVQWWTVNPIDVHNDQILTSPPSLSHPLQPRHLITCSVII